MLSGLQRKYTSEQIQMNRHFFFDNQMNRPVNYKVIKKPKNLMQKKA